MTFKVIFWGGVAVFFAVVAVAVFTPVALWKPAETTIAHPYTPVQMRGRTLFYSNGCNYCHTQYVRDVDNGMGPRISQGGDYVYDNPMILGSERTGPDLSYIGRKRNPQWEIDHLKDPRKYSPMSIMPSYEFLSDEDLAAIAEYLYYLGDRTAAEWMILPPEPYANKSGGVMGVATPATGTNPAPQGWPTFKDSGLYEGKLLYVSLCLTCHGCAGNGLGHYAGTLVVTPANFKADPFKDMPDDQWFWHVSEGVQGSVMPPWKESLTEEERWKVIRYVQQVYAAPFERDPDEGDPPAEYKLDNPLEVTVENIDAGKKLWTRECMVCHGDAGTGHGPYRQGIEPVPPDFSVKANYATYGDADYFWRISEGVPWTAMPTWKVQYKETERWQLVLYIRTMFTQTVAPRPAPPAAGKDFEFPDVMTKFDRIPETASYMRGRQQFLQQCAHCHGLAGDGSGPDGQYLNPKPANLHDMMALSEQGKTPNSIAGEFLARVSFGIQDTAMPSWGEFLPEEQRWDDVRFLARSFLEGTNITQSQYENGSVDIEYVRTDPGIFQDEIAQIDPVNGKAVYERWCATCHGADGKGEGPGTVGLASGSPAAFPGGMENAYIFFRVRKGVDDSMMYGFQPVLTEKEIWDVTAYVVNLAGGKFGG